MIASIIMLGLNSTAAMRVSVTIWEYRWAVGSMVESVSDIWLDVRTEPAMWSDAVAHPCPERTEEINLHGNSIIRTFNNFLRPEIVQFQSHGLPLVFTPASIRVKKKTSIGRDELLVGQVELTEYSPDTVAHRAWRKALTFFLAFPFFDAETRLTLSSLRRSQPSFALAGHNERFADTS